MLCLLFFFLTPTREWQWRIWNFFDEIIDRHLQRFRYLCHRGY
nr:hypothetical protein [Thermogemmatispora carboxidivorans]